jgi:hypothetical protein
MPTHGCAVTAPDRLAGVIDVGTVPVLYVA